MARAVLFLLLIILLPGCPQYLGVAPSQPAGEMTDAGYAVLSSLVDSVIVHPSDSMLVLRDSTTSGLFQHDLDSELTRVLLRVSQEIPSLKTETMQDFKSKNLTHTYIQDPLKIHPRCVRSSSTTRSFPMLEVSRVGFSSDGQQSLAYVGHSGAPLSGYGAYYVLSRQGGRWMMIGSYMIWIS